MDRVIAEHVLNTCFEALDERALVATKHHILHTLTTIVAGSNAPGVRPVLDLAIENGGREESRVLVHGDRLPAMEAALVNATMAHAQDFDMNDDRTFLKSSVVVIPTALALADRIGGVSGKDFITAACVGIDLGIRIALAVNPKPSHVLSQMIGGFGAVAAAARLLRFNEEQFLDALGLAYSQVSSSGGATASPNLTKRLLPALAARSSVYAALLAHKGFKSGRGVLRGPSGYFSKYHKVEGDHGVLLAELGERWEVTNVGPKGYPCCRVLHAPIDAALAVVKENDIQVGEIDKIIVRGSLTNIFIMADPLTEEGVERRRHPRGVVDAQFSVYWGVAAAVARRDVFLDCFTQDALVDPVLNALCDRVDVVASRTMERAEMLLAPASVEIRTISRGSFVSRADYARGNPRNPVTWEETESFLRRSAEFAAMPIGKTQIETTLELARSMERVRDIREMISALSTG